MPSEVSQNRLRDTLSSNRVRRKQYLLACHCWPGGAVRADALEPLRHLTVDALLRLCSRHKVALAHWLEQASEEFSHT